ncbi:hypothetical protein QJQ45_000255 [Haematococcus lacustris]|nr:hypothetical protein QJQ45_000255 [Haematococcus lacustris]
MLPDLLQCIPGIGSAVYLLLDLNSRRTLRLVCKQLRTTIDGAVDSLDFASSSSCDPDEVLQRLARTSLRPSKLEFCQGLQQQRDVIDNATAEEPKCLTQLTQLQHLDADGNRMSSNSLPLLAMLTQLAVLRLQSCQLCPSSQLSRFLFQHLTSLTVMSIHSQDLAALDCPQLQTLTLSRLHVDCTASLRACASGILQHCCALRSLYFFHHDQEPQQAAAGAGDEVLLASVLLEALAPWQPRSGKAIEMLGLWHLSDVTREALEWLPLNIKSLKFCQLFTALSDVCDALSGAAATQLPSLGVHELAVLVEGLSRCQLQGVDSRLPPARLGCSRQGGRADAGVGVSAGPGPGPSPSSSLDSCDDLLPRSSAASLLQQLAGWMLYLPSPMPLPSAGPCRSRSASITWVLLAWAFARTHYHHHQLYDKLGEAVLQGLQGSHLMPRLQQASRAAPRHPSSSSSSVAATHSRSGHGTRSTSPLPGLPLSLPAPPPSPASPLPSNPLARGPPQPSPLPTPLAQLSSTCLVQLLWAFASHEHCQAALLRAAAPVLSARILQGQLSSRRVACVAWAYARLQQLEPRLVSAILRHSMAHAEQ